LHRLALGRIGGGEQAEVEGPAADVAAVHVQGAAGVAGGVACLAEAVHLVEARLVTVVGTGIAWPLLLRHVGSLDSRRITRSLVRMVVATVPGFLWVLVVMAVAGSALRQGTFYGLASVIIGGGGAVLLYALCARMLRIDEFRVLVRTVTQRFT
jgi:hypothetical protein